MYIQFIDDWMGSDNDSDQVCDDLEGSHEMLRFEKVLGKRRVLSRM